MVHGELRCRAGAPGDVRARAPQNSAWGRGRLHWRARPAGQPQHAALVPTGGRCRRGRTRELPMGAALQAQHAAGRARRPGARRRRAQAKSRRAPSHGRTPGRADRTSARRKAHHRIMRAETLTAEPEREVATTVKVASSSRPPPAAEKLRLQADDGRAARPRNVAQRRSVACRPRARRAAPACAKREGAGCEGPHPRPPVRFQLRAGPAGESYGARGRMRRAKTLRVKGPGAPRTDHHGCRRGRFGGAGRQVPRRARGPLARATRAAGSATRADAGRAGGLTRRLVRVPADLRGGRRAAAPHGSFLRRRAFNTRGGTAAVPLSSPRAPTPARARGAHG